LGNVYSAIYGDTATYPPSADSLKKAQTVYTNTRNHLQFVLGNKGYTPKQVAEIVANLEAEGIRKAEQSATSYQASLGKKGKLDPGFVTGLNLYNQSGMLFETLFNADLESNDYGNTRFLERKDKGKVVIELEKLDGIENKCCVSFNGNPGQLIFSNAGKPMINNRLSTYIVHCGDSSTNTTSSSGASIKDSVNTLPPRVKEKVISKLSQLNNNSK